ncbi:unnamed protein product [Thelazia callipaeda]|uniref:UBP-type domain-containing protein n=1 Tax=Thelazia callipaeda TaxID=103827 RepID=A0A0N5CMP1_THECL|nr:unnamed protein product [Thelazia callipaeda]
MLATTSRFPDNHLAMHTVVPLPECPHLSEVREVPPEGVNAQAHCSECGSALEQWVCLTCYQVNCSRYIEGHAVHHQIRTRHPMVLSLSDFSVWCYQCESYVHNEILFPAKNSAHISKFGVPAMEARTVLGSPGE